jgi:hypothetical protein
MEEPLDEIKVGHLDTEINRLLAAIPETSDEPAPPIRYNQNEELFVLLDSDIIVPRLPIHHDIGKPEPGVDYIAPLRDLVRRLAASAPGVFQGLVYYFDPRDILRPSFFRLYRIEDSVFLYLLHVDLSFRGLEHEVIEPGLNDCTAIYRSRRLYLESTIVPLESVVWEEGRARAFRVRQLVSDTWIGETNRGLFRLGIWQDSALTKFFSRLVLPDGARTYPFYPLSCKYKTLCAEMPLLRSEYRRKFLPLLHRVIEFLSPEMERIQNSLKSADFSDKMPLFVELRERVPGSWKELFRGYASRPYLNERDMKEFSLEIPDS